LNLINLMKHLKHIKINRIRTDDDETYYEIAKIYSMKERKEEAIYYLKKAIDLETTYKIITYPKEKFPLNVK